MASRNYTLAGAATIALITLVGCGGGGNSGNDTGQLTVGLTDGPVESAFRVVVAFTGFQLKPAGGEPLDPITFNEASCDTFEASSGTCSINLLDLTGAKRQVVFNGAIPAGDYEWIRLMVDADRDDLDSYIQFDDEAGSMCPLWIPSGDQTGLKVVSGITVTANGVSDYTLDFDVRSSITAPPGQASDLCDRAQNYIMKPAIRVIDTTQTGTIAGTVPETLLDEVPECTRDENSQLYENAAVYVFENFDGTAVADDIDETEDNANPITTASVVYDGVAGTYQYEAGYLLSPEDYLLALTCTPAIDMPDSDELVADAVEEQPFAFITERTVTTIVDQTVDGSF